MSPDSHMKEVQLNSDDSKSALIKSLQLTQNRLLRSLNQTRIADKVSIKKMLEKFELLSVNQLAAEIKLIEVWKSINVEGCPTKLEPFNKQSSQNSHQLRHKPKRTFCDIARLQVSASSFNIDAARAWNNAPQDVQCAPTLNVAKKAIKSFCRSLPI